MAGLTEGVSRLVLLAEEIRRVDEGGIAGRREHGDDDGLLLGGLGTNCARPTEDEGVHAVSAEREHHHCKVAHARVERGRRERETDDGNSLADSDVPCALVELAGSNRDENSNEARNEVRGAGEDESNRGVEAKGLDDTIC